ncbi:MAG TPA: toll/interleukin-1 receptor domain-containing protein [Terriglobales bacterium]|nr:toll/interleukin-1 receptor domain-containing protein [Terriglobales bacterium]
MLTPSERVRLITQISVRLSPESWPVIDLTLKQFGLAWSSSWDSNDKPSYVIQMISDAPDDALVSLASHVGIETSPRASRIEPTFWIPGHFRLFLSHLAKHKSVATEFQTGLSNFNISAFVAHRDIEPTKEWQDEIELALNTADALVALLTDGFHASKWTDQEIGFVMGRGLLVIAVRLGEEPYGFIAKHQALQGNGQLVPDLVLEIYELLRDHKQTQKRMAEALVYRFEQSDSFKQAKGNIALLEDVKYWDSQLLERLGSAAEDNGQIAGSFGVPARIARLIEKKKA